MLGLSSLSLGLSSNLVRVFGHQRSVYPDVQDHCFWFAFLNLLELLFFTLYQSGLLSILHTTSFGSFGLLWTPYISSPSVPPSLYRPTSETAPNSPLSLEA